MTPQELMTPRCKVISEYPSCPFEEGQILTYRHDSIVDESYCDDMSNQPNTISAELVDRYDKVFLKLNWWEGVKVEDMPEYVKIGETWTNIFAVGSIHKCENWKVEKEGMKCTILQYWFLASELLPATLSEYTAYVNEKNK